MNVSTRSTATANPALRSLLHGLTVLRELPGRIPSAAVALLARVSMGAVFWRSAQTKVEGFALDPAAGRFELGWPHLSENALLLFEYEYQVPLLAPATAALLAAIAEHVLPVLLVLGLGTRWAALGLLGLTGVIQVFVYPEAWPTHGTWAAVLLWLAVQGPGAISVDHGLARRRPTVAPA